MNGISYKLCVFRMWIEKERTEKNGKGLLNCSPSPHEILVILHNPKETNNSRNYSSSCLVASLFVSAYANHPRYISSRKCRSTYGFHPGKGAAPTRYNLSPLSYLQKAKRQHTRWLAGSHFPLERVGRNQSVRSTTANLRRQE